MHYGRTPRGPLARRDRQSLPANCRRWYLGWFAVSRPAEQGGTGELARDPRVALVEAILFAAEEPLTARRIATVAGLADAAEAVLHLQRLQDLYERGDSAFQIEELAGGYQLYSRPELHPWLIRLRRAAGESRLTGAARETLAIVAYLQPILRAEIEAIRGVQCTEVLRVLMEKGLIRIAGRDDTLGRPVLYATTKKFLQLFGLKSLRDLPQADHLRSPARKPAEDDAAPDPPSA
jgi:segregation and condensation protein B